MLGFHSSVTNWDQFWISLWASLFSGAICTLFLSLIVGVFIWWLQDRIDKQRLRHQCQRELAIFREKLRFTLDHPQVTHIDSIVEAPTLAGAIVKLLTDLPIDLWHENVTDQQKNFISLLRKFQQTHYNFILAATTLQTRVRALVRQYNHKKGKIIAYDGVGQSFFLGRLLGFEDAAILPWLWGTGLQPEQLPEMEEIYSLISDDIEASKLIPPYKGARNQLENATDTLRSTLVGEAQNN